MAGPPPASLEAAPFLAELDPQSHVLLDGQGSELALELSIALVAFGGERPARECRLHGAARLSLVGAVVEVAGGGELRDLGERRVEGRLVRPELELAHARRVDDESAARNPDKLARDGRVAAASVAPDRADGQQLAPTEAVDDRRPGSRYDSSGASPPSVAALTASTGTPSLTASISASSSAGSDARSTLFTTITGSAPLSQAAVR